MKRRVLPTLFTAPILSTLTTNVLPMLLRSYQLKAQQEKLKIVSETGIDRLEAVELGGVRQWILMRGHDTDKPLLLILHGGPGLPLMPFHSVNAGLESDFIVVHWDQRGAGKSYSPTLKREEMTLEQLLSDTEELIRYLLKRFDQKKLYLLGFSWGSVLGLNTAHRHPELLHAYIGVGQVAHMAKSEAISYAYLQEKAAESGNKEVIRMVDWMGAPPYRSHRAMRVERHLVGRFGGFFHQGMDTFEFYKTGFSCPSYSLVSIRKLSKGLDFSAKMLWTTLYQVNFFETISSIEVPVYFLEGRYDYIVPSSVLVDFYEHLHAPKGKHLIWFEDSAHFPFLEEPERFQDVLSQQILPATLPTTP